MDAYLMLDVGGTNIKAGILDEKGALAGGEIYSFDAKARGSGEEIFRNFAEILCRLRKKCLTKDHAQREHIKENFSGENTRIKGIGMAFPGPFDYEHGISLMKGLNKYDAIYGLSIQEELKKYSGGLWETEEERQQCRFLFLHDVEAFALGECYFGSGKDSERTMFLCMGTGAGSAFAHNKRILKGEDGQVPPMGWIFNTPFKESIIDDYLSIRGLEALSKEHFGHVKSGLELYQLCGEKDKEALLVYKKFGKWLREAMLPFIESFHPDTLVLGGQLSKSFPHFGEELGEECEKRRISIYLTQDTSKRALEGLYTRMVTGNNPG